MSESLSKLSLHSRDKSNFTIPEGRVIRKRRKMTVSLMIPLWTLKLTPMKMKAEYYWAHLRRKVEVFTTAHCCTAQIQQVKSITSSISKPIHMTMRMLLNDNYGEPIKCQCPKGNTAPCTVSMVQPRCNLHSLISKKISHLVNYLPSRESTTSTRILFTTHQNTVVVVQQLK